MAAPKKSLRPKARPTDKKKGAASSMKTSPRPKLRPKNIGASPSGGTRGIDPRENYSPEDLKRLLESAGTKKSTNKKVGGGMCRGMGAATRGGNFGKNG